MTDDYSDGAWRFRTNTRGVHASHRSDHPEPAPRVVVGRSGAVAEDAGRPARVFEPGRFARAVELGITKLGPRQYRVRGQHEPHYDVSLDADPPCYCRDQEINGRKLGGNCKHRIAALLQERDPAAMAELVDRFIRQQQRLRDAGLLDEE